MESIFTTQTPGVTDASDATAYTLGTLWTADVGGQVHGIRWLFPTVTPSGAVLGLLYRWDSDTTGVELARATFSSPTLGAWSSVLFASPVDVVAGQRYIAAVWTPDHYVATAGLHSATTITHGHLTAPADSASAHNGRLYVGWSPTYPSSSFGGNGYFADVLFQASSSSTSASTADSVTLSDAVSRVRSGPRGTADTATLADAAARRAALRRGLPEGLVLADAVGHRLAAVRSTADALSLVDAASTPGGRTVTRPYAGVVTRPYSGVVGRP